ncbi:ImmA/IrrE family metallo-endopeptidase [Lacticaseibacillus sp. 53-4]|uniref:ImmA/IrrE family metallo-endopeptidase n=1 Tax=Lacticaseibacillus sp. 53-4 TaxID=2799575 RepID=UPI001940416B|nr:ImmA/IrrE family metallo-endopeptidase [Lacticaseibacillus sp. 53-4]
MDSGEMLSRVVNWGMDHGVSWQWLDLKPWTKPRADSESKSYVLNRNWPNKREIPFQAAHEIKHILNGDDGVYYYSTDRSQQIFEGDANRGALKILVPIYFPQFSSQVQR